MKTSLICCFALFLTVCIPLPRDTKAASFEDTRCKCVCSQTKDSSTGKEKRLVFKNTSEQCDCEHVVKPLRPDQSCSWCKCHFETRNTTTIKVVVVFVICVVSLLFVYMLFLLCLDPLLQRRPAKSYQQQTNEEEDLSSRPDEEIGPSASQGAEAMTARQRSLLNIVTKEQKKWKGTVQEQRKNIYDRHSMLN